MFNGDSVRPQDRHCLGGLARRVWLGVRDYRVAAAPDLAAARGLEEGPPDPAERAGRQRPYRLVPGGDRWLVHPRAKRGASTGPNPTDRAKAGTKRHLVTDAQGIPLAVTLTGANTHDVRAAEPTVQAIPPIRGPRGRPRRRPHRVVGDKGYDSDPLRQTLRQLGIQPEFPKRRTQDCLGRHRWVVERTISWLNRFRRLRIRYERLPSLHLAFLQLGCALICWHALTRWF